MTTFTLYGTPVSENMAVVLMGLLRDGDTLTEADVSVETWTAFKEMCDARSGRIRKFNMTLEHEVNPDAPVVIPPIEDRIKSYIGIISQEKKDAADVVTLRRSAVKSLWELVKELENTKEGKMRISDVITKCAMTEEEKEKYAYLLAAHKALRDLVSKADMVSLFSNNEFDNL